MYLDEIQPNEVLQSVMNLKTSHTVGSDGISSYLLQKTIHNILEPLTNIFNLSFKQGIFPFCYKTAKVIPVHKQNDVMEMNNYRPISLLPVLSKMLEKLMYSRLNSFIDSNNFLSDAQYGFRKFKSTELAVLDLTQSIMSNMDAKNHTIALFLDIKKAFDSINHSILLSKLYHIGVRGPAYTWFNSYLSMRSQYVNLNGASSERLSISTGVPQGSVLGPLLFLIFIDDLSRVSSCLRTILFADDTTLFYSGPNIGELTEIFNRELVKISSWLNANKLLINVTKTNYMIFGPRIMTNRFDINLVLNQTSLSRVFSIKFLGFIIRDNLSWDKHINWISNRICKLIGILYKLKNKFTRDIILKLYYSMMYPLLCYGIIIWGSSPPTKIKPLKLAQNYYLRCLFSLPKFTHISSYYKKANLLTLDQIYKFWVAKFMYRIRQNTYSSFFTSLFKKSYSSYSSRHHDDYCKPYHRLKIHNLSISSQGVVIWNNIPLDIKDLNNINLFKKRVRNFIFFN